MLLSYRLIDTPIGWNKCSKDPSKKVLIKTLSSTDSPRGRDSTLHRIKGTTSNRTRNQLKKKLKDFRSFSRMLRFTLPHLCPEIPEETRDKHLSFILHLYQSKGPEYVLRYLKASAETLEHLLLGLQGELRHEKVSIGKDSDGWPKWLGNGLKSNCLSNHLPSIRYATTLVAMRRLIVIPTYTNLESITSPITVDQNNPKLRKLLEDYTEILGEELEDIGSKFFTVRPTIGKECDMSHSLKIKAYCEPKLEVSLKSSPNGISIFSYPWDRAAVAYHDISSRIKWFTQHYFTGETDSWVEQKIEPYKCLVDSNRPMHVGKISLFHEPGKLKPRVFAIVDSLSQAVLKSLHDTLMRILQTIDEDCTYDHDKVVRKASSVHQEDEPFYGFADLSNATDRLPAGLYLIVGNLMSPTHQSFQDGLGTRWLALLQRPFTLGSSVRDYWKTSTPMPETVEYACGQPMGALSSWPFMALVHHTLVWYSFGSRSKARGKYLVLGDDVVIFDAKAYLKYVSTLDALGLSFTNNFSTVGFEFAKRVFYNGKEITGAYTAALFASRNVPEIFALEWRNLSTRGYPCGQDLPIELKPYLQLSKKKFDRCRLLMQVPYGTSITDTQLAEFALGLTGRSSCFLHKYQGNQDSLVEASKALRQAASVLIKQDFQQRLNAAKSAALENHQNFTKEFQAHSGLADQYPSVMQVAIEEYNDDSTLRIRYLERDLKLLFLNPTNREVLRPNLPDMPHLIDFSKRDRHIEKLRFRAEHQLRLMQLLRG